MTGSEIKQRVMEARFRECVRQRQRRRYANDPAYRLAKSSRRA